MLKHFTKWSFLKGRHFCGFLIVFCLPITKTCLYNFNPLKPQYYVVKLGLVVYIIFYFCSKHRLLVLAPHWGGSKKYPHSMFCAEIWKISEFLSENFHFLVVKFSLYMNRPVFVMGSSRNIENDTIMKVQPSRDTKRLSWAFTSCQPIRVRSSMVSL